MMLTKLDAYNYSLFPGVIRIAVDGMEDPDLVDILSEIARSEGRIFVEGHRFIYLDNYRLFGINSESFLELDVVEL